MNAKKFNLIMIGVLLFLVGGSIGLTIYANMWLTNRSKTLTATKLETMKLEEKQKVNQKAQTELSKNENTISILEKIAPKNKDQAKTIAELLQIAADTKIRINSITFPSSNLGEAAAKPAATPSSGSSSATTTAPAAPKTTAPTITQTKPVEGISGILGIEVNLAQIERLNGDPTTGVTYTQLLDFLKAIERNRRTMQVKLLQIQPIPSKSGDGIDGYSLTLTLNIFVKP